MPVYKLQQEMPYDELLKWITYYKRRPSGWQQDHRTYMLLSAQGVKESPEKLFPSLKAIKDASTTDDSERGAAPSGVILTKMTTARDGDNSGWSYKELEGANSE